MQLRPDEAAVVEKAVRLAIESVMNVLSAVNSARTHELQRLVTERERHIRRLEGRVREAEAELQLLLRPHSPRGGPSRAPEPRSSAEPESGAEQRDCEVRVSLSLLTGPPSVPPDGEEQDQSGDQCGSAPASQQQQQGALCPADPEPSGPGGEANVRESSRPTDRRVKQERLCPSPGRVKAEPVSPHCQPLQTAADGPEVFLQTAVTEELSPRSRGVLGLSELWQGVSSQAEDTVLIPDTAPAPHAAPVPHSGHVLHTVPWRSKTSVSRREQSEEAMRRRRASWRAASRRYYARKMARLQSHTSGLNNLNSLHSRTNSLSSLQSHTNSLNSLQSHTNSLNSLQSHTNSLNSLQSHTNSLNSLQSHTNSLNSLQSHVNSVNSLQSHASPGSAPQYPSCSGLPGSGGGAHSESWRYTVCDLAPLHHPPPPSSPDVTFISESDVLNVSLT